MGAGSSRVEAFRCLACQAQGPGEVTNCRPTADGRAIRRRRACLTCGARVTTYEVRALPAQYREHATYEQQHSTRPPEPE